MEILELGPKYICFLNTAAWMSVPPPHSPYNGDKVAQHCICLWLIFSRKDIVSMIKTCPEKTSKSPNNRLETQKEQDTNY